MKDKHTPTPWFVSINEDNNETVVRSNEDAEYEPIICNCEADFAMDSSSVYDIKANAEFICTACNSHEKLLEACKAIRDEMLFDAQNNNLDNEHEFMFDRIDAAIAEATKE